MRRRTVAARCRRRPFTRARLVGSQNMRAAVVMCPRPLLRHDGSEAAENVIHPRFATTPLVIGAISGFDESLVGGWISPCMWVRRSRPAVSNKQLHYGHDLAVRNRRILPSLWPLPPRMDIETATAALCVTLPLDLDSAVQRGHKMSQKQKWTGRRDNNVSFSPCNCIVDSLAPHSAPLHLVNGNGRVIKIAMARRRRGCSSS
jgi:hypothetical protein